MSVTIRAKLPKSDTNGLALLEHRFSEELQGRTLDGTDEPVLVVGVIQADTLELRPHVDDDTQLVKLVLVHVEAITEAKARATVDKIMRAVYVARTGKQELPFESSDGAGTDDPE